jgi:hypothetical protein
MNVIKNNNKILQHPTKEASVLTWNPPKSATILSPTNPSTAATHV